MKTNSATFPRAALCLGGAALALLLFSPPAYAQLGNAVLQGVVQDATDRKPMEAVVVVATSPAMQGEQITVTDVSGFYRIPNLPPGVYSIRFEREGFFPNERTGFELRSDTTVRINAALAKSEGEQETVKVTEKAPTVDVGSSSSGASLNSDFIKRVPVSAPGGKGAAARSFESVAAAAPNAAADSFGTSISGTTSPENSYMIDGLSVNNPGFGVVGSPLSSEFVKEVNVVTAGYLPEYGRATGGILTVVTKSGSNELHGGAFSFISPGGLEGARKGVAVSGQTVQFANKLTYIGDIGADIGGPIIKDKLWFYAGFDYARTSYSLERSLHTSNAQGEVSPNPISGATKNYTANLATIQAIGKLTWQLNPDNRINATLYYAPSTSGGDGQYSVLPGSGTPEVGPSSTPGTYAATATQRYSKPVDVNLKWTSEFWDKRLLFDTLVGVHHQSDGTLGADGSKPGASSGYGSLPGVLWRRGIPMQVEPHSIKDFEDVPGTACDAAGSCPVGAYYTGGPDHGVTSRLSDESHNRFQGSFVATYLHNWLGHHVFKAGLDGQMTSFRDLKSFWLIQESEDGTAFQDVYHFGILTGPDTPKYLNPITVTTKSTTVGGFIQDSWSVLDKVIVNLGLRYDAQYLYGSTGALAVALPNQWSPRIGAIYDFTHEGRSKIFASYAKYYENAPLALADVALVGEPHALGTRDATICKDPGDPMFRQACASDAALQSVGGPENPNTKFATIGQGGAPVDPEIKAPSTDELALGGEYELIPNARVGVTYTKRWMNRWIEDVSRDNMNTFFLANPGYGIASDFVPAKRNYDALTLYLMKAWANNWLGQVSYTASYLRGNLFGLFRPETGDLLPNYGSDWDLGYLMDTRDGPLPSDRRHVLKALGSKDWVLGSLHRLGTGFSLYAMSGGPTSYVGSDPLHGPREAYILPRGSGPRLPWQFGADVQLAYRVAAYKNVNMAVTMDIFNVFNLQGTTGRDEIYTEADVYGIKGGTTTDLNKLTTVDGMTPVKNPNFGHDNAYQAPRVFRFGVRGDF
jgi:hypothetical protein